MWRFARRRRTHRSSSFRLGGWLRRARACCTGLGKNPFSHGANIRASQHAMWLAISRRTRLSRSGRDGARLPMACAGRCQLSGPCDMALNGRNGAHSGPAADASTCPPGLWARFGLAGFRRPNRKSCRGNRLTTHDGLQSKPIVHSVTDERQVPSEPDDPSVEATSGKRRTLSLPASHPGLRPSNPLTAQSTSRHQQHQANPIAPFSRRSTNLQSEGHVVGDYDFSAAQNRLAASFCIVIVI